MKFIKNTLSLATVAILGGCAAFGGKPMPEKLEDPLPQVYEERVKEWERQELPITLINSDTNFVVEKRKKIPQRILDKKIEKLSLENASYQDLIFVLKAEGIDLFIGEEITEEGSQAQMQFQQQQIASTNANANGISESQLSPLQQANKVTQTLSPSDVGNLNVHEFTGTIGQLLDIIESTSNVSFNYKYNNTIFLEKTSLFLTATPQDEETAKELVKQIESLGAREVTYSLSSGFMMYRATNHEFEMISEFFKHYYKNFATIKLQVSVISVDLKRDFNTGFDWGGLQASLGNLSLLQNARVDNIVNGVVGAVVDGDEGDSQFTNEFGSNLSEAQYLTAVNSDQATFLMQKGDTDIQGVFNLLSQYGNTKTSQSIFLETISGKELNLENTREVPFTGNINQTVTGLGNAGFQANGFNSQVEEEGMNIKFVPYFNFNKNTVTLSIELDLKTITGFKQLNAGNGNGTVEQPETTQQKFNSVVEIIPGSTHLVGGIMTELESDQRNNLNFLDNAETASKDYAHSKNALFILLRPTVTIYSDLENIDNIDQIELLNKYFRKDSIYSDNKQTVVDPRNIKKPEADAEKVKSEANEKKPEVK